MSPQACAIPGWPCQKAACTLGNGPFAPLAEGKIILSCGLPYLTIFVHGPYGCFKDAAQAFQAASPNTKNELRLD